MYNFQVLPLKSKKKMASAAIKVQPLSPPYTVMFQPVNNSRDHCNGREQYNAQV